MGENPCQLFIRQGTGNQNRDLKKLNPPKKNPKNNNPMKKWATELNRTFSKEDIQMAKNEKMLTNPGQETQIKITLRFYLTPVRMATIKNTNKKCW
jgi:hypothetical protein